MIRKSRRNVLLTSFALGLVLVFGCETGTTSSSPEIEPVANSPEPTEPTWAIALHGGAGKPPKGIAPEKIDAYKKAVKATLEKALTEGRDILAKGGTALDAVEHVVRIMEDDPNLNAGRGAALNIDGGIELHASIMDGKTLDGGAVAAVNRIRNPISAARKMMTDTDFLLMVGEGAEAFAEGAKLEMTDPEYFKTDLRKEMLQQALEDEKLAMNTTEIGAEDIGTVGCVALDSNGNLAAATSTGGVAHKMYGRMGDSSILGAGNYANNETCAVSCTGRGEYFIRHVVAFHVAALMKYKNMPLKESVRYVIDDVLKEGTGGLIAVDKKGNIVMDYNRDGMRRAAADSNGKFVVEYWD